MKGLLTGVAGNLGYEACLSLSVRGINVVSCVWSGGIDPLSSYPVQFELVVEYDLVVGDGDVNLLGEVDCIIHCGGVVHFNRVGDKNQQIMFRIVKLAKKLKIPVYAVGTAFVYKLHNTSGAFNNYYEEDMFLAEQILLFPGVPYDLARLSILTGHSSIGSIQNFNGYCFILRAFISAIHKANEQKSVLGFSRMTGIFDMTQVYKVAEQISAIVERGQIGETIYITNPESPHVEWLLDETLNFYSVRDVITMLDVLFQEFGKLDLTEEGSALYKLASRLSPYWPTNYEFPNSVCKANMIDFDFLKRILTRFHKQEYLQYE